MQHMSLTATFSPDLKAVPGRHAGVRPPQKHTLHLAPLGPISYLCILTFALYEPYRVLVQLQSRVAEYILLKWGGISPPLTSFHPQFFPVHVLICVISTVQWRHISLPCCCPAALDSHVLLITYPGRSPWVSFLHRGRLYEVRTLSLFLLLFFNSFAIWFLNLLSTDQGY